MHILDTSHNEEVFKFSFPLNVCISSLTQGEKGKGGITGFHGEAADSWEINHFHGKTRSKQLRHGQGSSLPAPGAVPAEGPCRLRRDGWPLAPGAARWCSAGPQPPGAAPHFCPRCWLPRGQRGRAGLSEPRRWMAMTRGRTRPPAQVDSGSGTSHLPQPPRDRSNACPKPDLFFFFPQERF